eukprot:TRINITY_DN75565_c0_g1_i1.p1 TRINITY_DN75565_c0_g1~~TRINITY_DN75565_c0_g1_i1.p1  ORF type:complete len:496 (-),score=71.77 TRINITY_DN75565_c0_g1_i1:297-1715(-)
MSRPTSAKLPPLENSMSMPVLTRAVSQRLIDNTQVSLSGAKTQTSPFSLDALGSHFDADSKVYMEIGANSRVYELICDYIAKNSKLQSFRFKEKGKGDNNEGMEDESGEWKQDEEVEGPPGAATLGLGCFFFTWGEHQLSALHQTMGQPVGLESSVAIYTNLVIFVKRETPHVLEDFCNDLILKSEAVQEGMLNIFEWHVCYHYWEQRSRCKARPMESVVLSQEMKDRLVNDITDFLDPDTKQWYNKHGIPHKRGYLFFGVPGAGKTSAIQAIAGKFKYNIGHLHPTHPKMTDDSLSKGVHSAPSKALLIFEDVDAIFGPNRQKLIHTSDLTFTGLLNALDGVGKANGQIFILTTNFRERLDGALIRNGRVDVHIQFTVATDEQVYGFFVRFYPEADDEKFAEPFVKKLRDALQGRDVSPAALQHFFIMHRKSSAEHASNSAGDVVREMEHRATESSLRAVDKKNRKVSDDE